MRRRKRKMRRGISLPPVGGWPHLSPRLGGDGHLVDGGAHPALQGLPAARHLGEGPGGEESLGGPGGRHVSARGQVRRGEER